MQDVVDAFARLPAFLKDANIAFNELEVSPLRGGNEGAHLVQVALISRREVVEPHHALVEFEQGFQHIRADKASDAGDQPGFWGIKKASTKLLIRGHSGLAHRCRSAYSTLRIYFRS